MSNLRREVDYDIQGGEDIIRRFLKHYQSTLNEKDMATAKTFEQLGALGKGLSTSVDKFLWKLNTTLSMYEEISLLELHQPDEAAPPEPTTLNEAEAKVRSHSDDQGKITELSLPESQPTLIP